MDENPHKGVPRCPPSFLQLSPNALPTSSDLASIISSGDNSLLVSKSSFIAFEHNYPAWSVRATNDDAYAACVIPTPAHHKPHLPYKFIIRC